MDKLKKYWQVWLSIRAHAAVAAAEAKWVKYNLKREEYRLKAKAAKAVYEAAAAALPKVLAGQQVSVSGLEVKNDSGLV